MAAIVEVQIDKISLQDLEQMAPRLEREMPELIRALTREAAKAAREKAPVGPTGRVKKSIKPEVHGLARANPEAAVVSDWFVARLQNYGYTAHRAWIKRNRRWADIPGKPKRPAGYFIEPAVEEAIDKILDREMNRVVGRL